MIGPGVADPLLKHCLERKRIGVNPCVFIFH